MSAIILQLPKVIPYLLWVSFVNSLSSFLSLYGKTNCRVKLFKICTTVATVLKGLSLLHSFHNVVISFMLYSAFSREKLKKVILFLSSCKLFYMSKCTGECFHILIVFCCRNCQHSLSVSNKLRPHSIFWMQRFVWI